MLLGPAGRVSGGLEAARSKGVLGFDGIKIHRMAGGLVSAYPPMLDTRNVNSLHYLCIHGVCNSRQDDEGKAIKDSSSNKGIFQPCVAMRVNVNNLS